MTAATLAKPATLGPDGATRIETMEMHTGGEPVRIVTAGLSAIPGATILEKRRFARDRLDGFRRLIMFEPRGHYDMYGVLPVDPDHTGRRHGGAVHP